MKVYRVYRQVDYEGDDHIGIATTPEKALAIVQQLYPHKRLKINGECIWDGQKSYVATICEEEVE